MLRHWASPQAARYPGQKKSGLSPTHFSVLLRSALKAKPKDKFVCPLRIRRFQVKFNGSRPLGRTLTCGLKRPPGMMDLCAGGAAFPSIKAPGTAFLL